MSLLDTFSRFATGFADLAAQAVAPKPAQTNGAHAFTFGEPEAVLNPRADFLDHLGVFRDGGGQYYVPPVDLRGLAKLRRANPHHGAILEFKRNMVAMFFADNAYITHQDMEAAAYDFVALENCYFQKIFNRLGGLLALKRLPAVTMRVGIEPDTYFQVPRYGQPGYLQGQAIPFKPGEVIHLKRIDIEQDIYGIPGYLGGMQSVLLSEDATLFRRRFYRNGAAMGYVFATIGVFDKKTAEELENKINDSTGEGQFRNLFVNIPKMPNIPREPIKIAPIGDIKTADDYDKIKNMNIREVLACHRAQPGITGVLPDNLTGFGDLLKCRDVWFDLEVPPLHRVFQRLNQYLPRDGQVAFQEPKWIQQSI